MINRFAVFTTMLCAATLSSTPKLEAQKSEVKNIVLVHGAWADGSGWRGVYDNLVRNGFNVSIVKEPETSLQYDVTAVKRILTAGWTEHPCRTLLRGGAVVTEAGTDPSVVGLVYVAAHMPDAGESPRSFIFSLQPIRLSSWPPLCPDPRYSTHLTTSKLSSPRLHGEKNRVGWSSPERKKLSTSVMRGAHIDGETRSKH
jgi:hypothetical protein